MTRGFHHPAETFFKNHLHAVRSYPRPPKICRRSLLRVLQRHSKIFHSVLHAKGRRPCRKDRKPHLTRCCSIYYICIYQILSLLLRHKKGLQHGIEKGNRGGPGKTHPKTQAAPSGNGGGAATHYGLPALPEPCLRACGLHRVCTVGKLLKPVPFIYVIIN